MNKTISKQLSNQSNPVVDIRPEKRSKCQKYMGFRDITFKDILLILFTLLIPTMIGVLTVVLQKNEIDLTEKGRQNDYRIGQLQRQSDEQQTEAVANETIFNNYMKNIIDLTLYYKTDAVDSPQYKMTRVLTITALRQLNLEKKKLVIRFLYDIEFLQRRIFIFFNEDRNESFKHLEGAILDNLQLDQNLKLTEIVLRRVSLINTSFAQSDLEGSDFTDSILTGVNFSHTNLISARFINTQLQQTDFRGASLANAQFIRSNLTQSNINDEQLSQVLTIYNTILPNGTYARNKSYVINGDGKQGTNGWNITSGDIRVKDSYFFGTNNSIMVQRINTTLENLFSSSASFEYCLSFAVHGQDNLIVEITFIDTSGKFNSKEVISPSKSHRISKYLGIFFIFVLVRTNSCENNSSNSLIFCYWSMCNNSKSSSNYMDLKFIFGYKNASIDFVALKYIDLAIIAE